MNTQDQVHGKRNSNNYWSGHYFKVPIAICMDESPITYGSKHLVTILIQLSIRKYTSFFINRQNYTHAESRKLYIETDINNIVTEDETSHLALHFGAKFIFVRFS